MLQQLACGVGVVLDFYIWDSVLKRSGQECPLYRNLWTP